MARHPMLLRMAAFTLGAAMLPAFGQQEVAKNTPPGPPPTGNRPVATQTATSQQSTSAATVTQRTSASTTNKNNPCPGLIVMYNHSDAAGEERRMAKELIQENHCSVSDLKP